MFVYLENGTYTGYTKIQQHGRCELYPRLPSDLLSSRVPKAPGLLFRTHVDEGIGDEAIEVQRPNVVVVGRGRTKLEIEHHVASGHAQHRTCCDACMRARGIAGIHERREPGREDEDPLVAMD